MDDNTFYFRVCMLATIFCTTIVASCTIYSMYNAQLMQEAVLKGADPMKYSCAQSMGDRSVIVCAQYLSSK